MRLDHDRRARGGRGDQPATSRASLYDEVTDRIISELETGRIPWAQPWGTVGATTPGLPRNAVTGRSYSGVNVLILWGALFQRGHISQAWLTFNQARVAGGSVRKGERGVTIVYADRFTPQDGKQRAGESGQGDSEPASLPRSDDRQGRTVPFLKRFTVFNVAQCDDLPPGLAPDPEPLPERETIPAAEAVIAASGVDFRIGGDRAYYAPDADHVQVPPQPAFYEQINFYRTALHELTHATGHTSRLGRDLANRFGTKGYAREELVAEMGSAFLCAALGIVPTVRHADYLAAWLTVLRGDNRAIFRAASAATKAADWLLARRDARQAGRGSGAA